MVRANTVEESNDVFDMKLDITGENDNITAFDNHHCRELNSSYEVSHSEIELPEPDNQKTMVKLVVKRKRNEEYTYKGIFCLKNWCNSSCQKQRYTRGNCIAGMGNICYCYVVCLAPKAES